MAIAAAWTNYFRFHAVGHGLRQWSDSSAAASSLNSTISSILGAYPPEAGYADYHDSDHPPQ